MPLSTGTLQNSCPKAKVTVEFSLAREASPFLFYSGLQFVGWGRANCFTQASNRNANLTPNHPHKKTLRILFGQVFRHPRAKSG